MKNKPRLLTRVKVMNRAYLLIKGVCPGLMRVKLIRAIVSAVQPFIGLWLSARIIGELAGARDTSRLITLVAITLIAGFGLSMLMRWLDTMNAENEAQMWSYLGSVFSSKQMTLDYSDVTDAGIQKRMLREKENLYTYGNGLGQFVWSSSDIIEGALSVICSISMTAALFTLPCENAVMNSPLWALPILLIIALGAVCYRSATKRENKEFTEWCEKTPRMNRAATFFGWTLVSESDRAKDVRIYRQDAPADKEMERLMASDKADKSHRLRMSRYEPVATFVTGLGNALGYLFVVLRAYFGAFGAGGVVQYAGALSKLSGGISKVIFAIEDSSVYTEHLSSLFEFLDIPSKRRTGTLPAPNEPRELTLKNVSFKYPGTEEWALRDVSLTLSKGRRLALVGRNGSGKSTLVKLICGLYEPTEGNILLDGRDIADYDYDEYISLLSVVFQDFKLFSFPLGQNVAAGAEVDKERALKCLYEAGFSERLSAMPEGLNTYLYKETDGSGVDISGGEAQKIALARAMYRGSPLLIMDEPTAALDPVAEYEVYTHLSHIADGKTAIYISHRLASCRFCDEIAVIDAGRLVQSGCHASLIADEKGLYNTLWEAQAEYYKEKA